MSDLRDSGAIEQDSDVVLLLWRSDPKCEGEETIDTELEVAKQRQGPSQVQMTIRLRTAQVQFVDVWHVGATA